MPKVSVLMGVYNEQFSQIDLAIKSILSQTFTDYELIIVNDAPENKKMKEFLTKEKKLSSKINVYTNKENIGLADSMNKAFKYSTGQYIARMDSDDISLPTRLEKEAKILDSGKYDFVFTNYNIIDEQGNLIKEKASEVYSPKDIVNNLYKKNIIHHPTIMMTRDVFMKAKGYRKFPCAQDYDFWLRLINLNCRFYMINEVLFNYRIRSTSTTARKKVQQKITIEYSRKLFLERLKNGRDTYSYEGYEQYVKAIKSKYRCIDKQMERSNKQLRKAQELKKEKKYIESFLYRVNVFLSSSFYRDSYIKQKQMIKKIEKFLANN